MRKSEEKYIKLLEESLKDKNKIIDELLRINESVVYETRGLIHELKELIRQDLDIKKSNKKEGK